MINDAMNLVFENIEVLALAATIILIALFSVNIVFTAQILLNQKSAQYKKVILITCLIFIFLFMCNIASSIVIVAVVNTATMGLFSILTFSLWAAMCLIVITMSILAIKKMNKEKSLV